MADKFPTAVYEANDYLVCPNGDKLRSDDEGTFCWLDGARVSAVVGLGGQIVLQPVEVVEVESLEVEPVVPTTTAGGKKKKATPADEQQEQTDANG